MSNVRVKLKRSRIGVKKTLKKTLDALGLKKINQVREYKDSPALRGMLFKVKYLIEVENLEGSDETK